MENILNISNIKRNASNTLPSQTHHHWETCKKRLKARIPASLYRSLIIPLKTENNTKSKNRPGETVQSLELVAPNKKIAGRINERYLSVIKECLSQASFQGEVHLRYESIDGYKGSDANDYGINNYENNIQNNYQNDGQNSYQNSYQNDGQNDGQNGYQNSGQMDSANGSAGRKILSFSESGMTLPGLENLFFSGINHLEIERLWNGGKGIFLIIGEAGSGKTAIGRAYMQSRQQKRGLSRFLSMETFLTEFAQAASKRDGLTWRSRLRAHQHLVLDDFQYLKPQAARSQEELLCLIDEFMEKNKSLLLCSALPINKMRLSAPLTSRLQAGHTIFLKYPSQSNRKLILQAECQRRKIHLSPQWIDYLSQRISQDMRRLKSAANRLEQLSSIKMNYTISNRTAIDNSSAGKNKGKGKFTSGAALGMQNLSNISREQLDHLCHDLYTRHIVTEPAKIIKIVADFCNVPIEAIYGPARDKKYSLARHLVAYICSECLDMNLREIARVIGRREHGSVLHARKKIMALMENDLFFRHQVEDMMLQLQ